MTVREQIQAILKEVKPTKDLVQVTDIIEGGYLDSFELMLLISRVSDQFSMEIGVEEITPDNFNSVDAIVSMVERLTAGRT